MSILRRVRGISTLRASVVPACRLSSKAPPKDTLAEAAPTEATGADGSSTKAAPAEDVKVDDPTRKKVERAPTTWLALAATAAVATGGLWYYSTLRDQKLEKITTPRTFGKASVGGPFRLVNTEGKVVTDEDYRGKFLILYFGFTFCPDICPDELDKLSAAIDLLPEPDQEKLVPILISVDPYRDTPERVKEYLKDFHPKFEGLTGDEDEIEKVAKEYRVYFSKADVTEVGDDYLMDHSIITYLMDPEGNFLEFFGKTATEKEIADRIKAQIRKYQFAKMTESAVAKRAGNQEVAQPATASAAS